MQTETSSTTLGDQFDETGAMGEVGQGFGQPPRIGLETSSPTALAQSHPNVAIVTPLPDVTATVIPAAGAASEPAAAAASAGGGETGTGTFPQADGSVGTTPQPAALEIPGGEVAASGKRRPKRKASAVSPIPPAERLHLEELVGDYPFTTMEAVGTFVGLVSGYMSSTRLSDLPAAIVTAALLRGHNEADVIAWSKHPPTCVELGKTRQRSTPPGGASKPPPHIIEDDDGDDDEEEEDEALAPPLPSPSPPASPASPSGTTPARFRATALRIAAAKPAGPAIAPSAGTPSASPPAPLPPTSMLGTHSPSIVPPPEFSAVDEEAIMLASSLKDRIYLARRQNLARLYAVRKDVKASVPPGHVLVNCGGQGDCFERCVAKEGSCEAAERRKALMGAVTTVPGLMLTMMSLDEQPDGNLVTAEDVSDWMRRQALSTEPTEAPMLLGWALASHRCVMVSAIVEGKGMVSGAEELLWRCYGVTSDPQIYLNCDQKNEHYKLWEKPVVVDDEKRVQLPPPPTQQRAHKTPFVPTANALGATAPAGVRPRMTDEEVATRIHMLEAAHADEIRTLGQRVGQLEASLRGLSPRTTAVPAVGTLPSWTHGGPFAPRAGPDPTAGAPSAVILPTMGGFTGRREERSPPSVTRPEERTCYACGRVGHLRRWCPLNIGGAGAGPAVAPAAPASPVAPVTRLDERTCWTCGRVGHVQRWCPGRGGGAGPHVGPGVGAESGTPVAATTASAAVPLAAVHHSKVSFAEEESTQRHRHGKHRKHHRSSSSARAGDSGASQSESSSSSVGSGSGQAFHHSRRSSRRSRRGHGHGQSRSRGSSVTRHASPPPPPPTRRRSPSRRRSNEQFLLDLLIGQQHERDQPRTTHSRASPIDPELIRGLVARRREDQQ